MAGYEIVYSTKKNFGNKNTKVVGAKKTAYTLSGLKKNTKYYVKMRAYRRDSKGNKLVGNYSAVKSIAKK